MSNLRQSDQEQSIEHKNYFFSTQKFKNVAMNLDKNSQFKAPLNIAQMSGSKLTQKVPSMTSME